MEETMECPVCRIDVPLGGPEGIIRHLIADHPDDPLSEAIVSTLIELEVQEALA